MRTTQMNSERSLLRGVTPLALVLLAGALVGCSNQRNPYENQDDSDLVRARPQLTVDEANRLAYTERRTAVTSADTTIREEQPRREVRYDDRNTRETRRDLASDRGMSTTVMYFPTGDRESSTLMVERIAPTEVIVGAPFQYRMRVTNLTDQMNLHNVFVSESTDGSLDITSSSMQPTRGAPFNWNGQFFNRADNAQAFNNENPDAANASNMANREAMTWNVGTLQPKESKVIEVEARTDQAGSSTTCILAGYNPEVCVTMNAVAPPSIALALRSPREVLICEDIPLRYEVTNTGDSHARDVRVRVAMPEGWRSQRDAELRVGDLAPGETKTVDFTARAERPGEFTLARAEAMGAMGVSAQAESATISVVQPELRVDFDAPETTYLGRDMGSKITITNPSNIPLRDVRVTADFAGARFEEARREGAGADRRGGDNTWSIGTLGPGETRESFVRLNADRMGDIRGRIRAEAYCAQPQVQEFTTRVVGIPALLLEVVDERDPVRIGDETVYSIRVTNQGSAPATNIVILGVLPSGQEFVAARGFENVTADQRDFSGNRSVQFAPVASLAPKASAEWQIRVRATAPGDVRFGVRMTADQLDAPVEETESTNLVD